MFRYAECVYDRVIIRILYEDGGVPTFQQPTENETGHRPDDAGLGRIGGERKAQTGESIKPDDRQSQRRHRTNQRRHNGNVMNEIGADGAINTSRFQNSREQTNRVHTAATPMNWMQVEAFLPDLIGVIADARGNVHFIAGLLRCARHRQAM